MPVLSLLRWICGYNEISVCGRFPERFLNLASKNGVMFWKISSDKEKLSVCIKRCDTKLAEKLAKKAECSLSVQREHGLPYLCLKYRHRSGLLVGAILSAVLCCMLSCCIWNITINAPAGINEYEIRQELEALGFREGIIYRQDQIRDIETKLSINDKRISWISINVAGTNATVELSAGINAEKNDQKKENAVSNLKSAADGTITRISVRKGTSAVQIGEGVHKGQLLVSGIAELPDGSNKFYDSDGEVYASTYRTVELTVPKSIMTVSTDGINSEKMNLSLYGICFPVFFSGTPDGNYISRIERNKCSILGQDIPLKSEKQSFISYKENTTDIDIKYAEKLLKNRFELYRLFLSSDGKTVILDEKAEIKEEKNCFRMKVYLTTEENICEKSYITIKGISQE